jgi:hypothetical protein
MLDSKESWASLLFSAFMFLGSYFIHLKTGAHVDMQNCANVERGIDHRVYDIENVSENIWDNIIQGTKQKGEEDGTVPAESARRDLTVF